MISDLASSAVEGGFEPLSGQTKDYKTVICCFSAKHPTLRSKSKDWLFKANSTIFQLYHVNFRWDDDEVRFLLDQHAEIDLSIVLAHWSNSPQVDMSLHLADSTNWWPIYSGLPWRHLLIPTNWWSVYSGLPWRHLLIPTNWGRHVAPPGHIILIPS
jgi:hypothetical protein